MVYVTDADTEEAERSGPIAAPWWAKLAAPAVVAGCFLLNGREGDTLVSLVAAFGAYRGLIAPHATRGEVNRTTLSLVAVLGGLVVCISANEIGGQPLGRGLW
jgi:hypothetical protein